MILLADEFTGLIVALYFICHLPAFIMLFMGINRLKTRPENAKTLITMAVIYFIVGGGICYSLVG